MSPSRVVATAGAVTGAMGAGAVVAAAAAVLAAQRHWYPAAAVLGVLALTAAGVAWTLRPARRRAPGADRLGRVADRLAAAVRYPEPPEVLLRVRLTGPGVPDVPGDEATVPGIDALFAQVPGRRLVVLGAPGAGKTVTAYQLARRLAADRPAGGPVPVVVEPASWDPAAQTLPDWLAAQLTRSYGLGRPGLARALVDAGLVLPLLDGLDTMAAGARPLAVRALGAALPGRPLLVTCGTSEYQDAVAALDDPPSTTVVRLAALELDVAVEYLRATAGTAGSQRRWRPVVERVAADPDGPLARALCRPLLLMLARTRYNPPAAPGPEFSLPDPAELADLRRFGGKKTGEEETGEEAVAGHLLSAFVAAAYRSAGGRRAASRARRAERSLVALARDLTGRGSRELAWWELADAIAKPRRADVWIVGLAAFAVVVPVQGWFVGALWALVCAVSVGFRPRWMPEALNDGRPRRVVLRPPSRESFTRNLRLAASSGLLTGVFVGVWKGYEGGVVRGVLAGLVAAAVMAFANWWAGPIRSMFNFDGAADITAVTARRSLAWDRWCTVLQTSEGTVMGALAGYATLILPGYGIPLGIVIGSVALLHGAWGRFTLARVWWRLKHGTPLRLLAFLEEAERRQVLISAGPVYRFRHASVQRHLAFGGGGAALVGEPAEEPETPIDLPEPALPAPPADPDSDRRSLADLHGTITTMALTPGGRYLVTAGVTPAALVWDVGDLDAPTSEVAVTHTRWNDGDTPIRAVAVSPTGHLLATGTLLGAVGLFDFTDPTQPRPLTALDAHQQDVPGLAFHPDGHLLAVASQDHTVSLWDVTDPLAARRLATLHGHRQPARSVRFSPDGRWLVTGGRDATVLVWDVTRPEQPVLRHRLPSGTGWVYTTAFDTTGDTLAIAGKHNAVTLWSVPEAGTPRRVARLKKDAAFTAAFSADGHLLATGHRGGAAIWDTTDPTAPVLLRRLSGYGPMATAEFHPTGRVLVTGGLTGALIAWPLDAVNPAALPPR